jgi:hypothetical protein
LLPYLYPERKDSSKNCRKEISSGPAISKTESFHQQVSLLLFRRIRLLVEGELFQGTHFSIFIFYLYFKVYLLEGSHTFFHRPTVRDPLEYDLLGGAIYPFLFPQHSKDSSIQTEIRNWKMSD